MEQEHFMKKKEISLPFAFYWLILYLIGINAAAVFISALLFGGLHMLNLLGGAEFYITLL